MDADDAADEFGRLYPMVYGRFYRRVPVRELRLSAESLATLQHLARSGPLTVTEAADHFGRSQSAMSEMIDRLEARGLLARMADERDRRRTLVWLTAAGEDAIAAAAQVLAPELLRVAFATIDPAVRRALLEGMTALVEAAPVAPRQPQPQEPTTD